MKQICKLFGVLMVVLALSACQGSGRADKNTPMQLKSYSVPVQKSAALENTLIYTLENNGVPVSVSQPFPGTLLVFAPRDAQTSISQAIADLSKASKKAPLPARLNVHFWVVEAVPGPGKSSPPLKPLDQTLDQLRTSLGASHFILRRSVSTVTTLHHHSEITSGPYKFAFTAQVGQNGATLLDIQYHATESVPTRLASAFGKDSNGINSLQTTVATSPGQYVVLAMAPTHAVPATSSSAKTPPAPSMRLLVMRVDQRHPASR